MHICFLCNEYPPNHGGGIGTFTQTLARKLVAKGHYATVIGIASSANETVEDDLGVQVIRLSHTKIPRAGFIFNNRKLFQKLIYVHSNHPIDLLEGPESSFGGLPDCLPFRTVIRMHGGHHFFHITLGEKPKLWRSWLEKRSFARADYLCAVSNFVANKTRDFLNLHDRAIEVIPNPVDTNVFVPQLCESEMVGLILFIGTVCEKKGIRQLIEAMPFIVQAAPNAHLWVVGRDWKDPRTGASYTNLLKRQISTQVNDNIFFKGPIAHSQLPTFITKAQICVYPSHMEAMPMAWLEGLAMGKAIVASATGPGPEIIQNGVNGLLCNPYDPVSIAEKVIRLLKDSELRNTLKRQARKHAVQEFAVDKLFERNEAFYRRCIEVKV